MDGFITNLKNFITKKEVVESSRPPDRNRAADVRQTMAKTDSDGLVDVDEMTQLAGVTPSLPKLDDIRPRQSKNEVTASSMPSIANPISAVDTESLSALRKPSSEEYAMEDQKEEKKGNELKNPLEDDIFTYYD